MKRKNHRNWWQEARQQVREEQQARNQRANIELLILWVCGAGVALCIIIYFS